MNNKLIVDSGSTKTDWAIIKPKETIRFTTPGINPSTNTTIYDLMKVSAELVNQAADVSEVHYFGAGVIDNKTKSIIQNWLEKYFHHVEQFEIESDMLGAARATAGNKPGIISILGTGSNSCVYDGTRITKSIPSFGYVLSNEGGGSKIGAELIKAYFYRLLPPEIEREFENRYKLTKSDVIESLYHKENPTAYLASFAEFVNDIEDDEWRDDFLFPIFEEFADIRIKQFPDYLEYDLYFVGSIAYFYADVINDVLEYYDLTCELVIHKPIDGLVDYYK